MAPCVCSSGHSWEQWWPNASPALPRFHPCKPPSLQLFMPWANGFTSAEQRDSAFPASYFGDSLAAQKVWINKGIRRVCVRLPVGLLSTSWLQYSTIACVTLQAWEALWLQQRQSASLLCLCLKPERIDDRGQNLLIITGVMATCC